MGQHRGVTWTVQRCETSEGAVWLIRLFREVGGRPLAYEEWDPDAASEEERRLADLMIAKLPELPWNDVRGLPRIQPHEGVGNVTAEDCRRAFLLLQGAQHPDLLAEVVSLLDDYKRDGSPCALAAFQEARSRLREALLSEEGHTGSAPERDAEASTEAAVPVSTTLGVA